MADVESEPLGGDAPFFDSNGGADGAVADTTTARPPSSGLETPKLAKLRKSFQARLKSEAATT